MKKKIQQTSFNKPALELCKHYFFGMGNWASKAWKALR